MAISAAKKTITGKAEMAKLVPPISGLASEPNRKSAPAWA